MYQVEMQDVTDEFARCWQAAGRHLQSQMQGADLSWLKAEMNTSESFVNTPIRAMVPTIEKMLRAVPWK